MSIISKVKNTEHNYEFYEEFKNKTDDTNIVH